MAAPGPDRQRTSLATGWKPVPREARGRARPFGLVRFIALSFLLGSGDAKRDVRLARQTHRRVALSVVAVLPVGGDLEDALDRGHGHVPGVEDLHAERHAA